MSKLALLGGEPVLRESLDWREIWPPTDESTAKKLEALFYSRKWTAFDETEGSFAQAFASYHGCRHGIFMVNGTVTLQCALGAYGIGPGDEVIVPALTWYATAMAAHYLGAHPVFVDIDPETLCIDPEKIKGAITERTKAIIPVHLYGSMADMDQIMAIAREHDLKVIEDCAQMHGGIWDGKGVGSIGHVGSFSFQHSKIMASAEGGACITDDAEIAERIFRMKHIGYGPGEHPGHIDNGPPPDLLCYPFRATAFQALILNEQLKSLDTLLERYVRAAKYLRKRLSESTRIRFQQPGKKADRQAYYAWAMIFDDPSYMDIPLDVIHKAIAAEGLPLMSAHSTVYKFILFNLKPESYRIHEECNISEKVGARVLRLLHPYLGLDSVQVEKFADIIEKVAAHADELRKHAKER
jgi:L-glutamine:2-deoxy-scyllo-inosose/3-amino-2,3-dideoxy-scyllo-inosose aminotransferase